MRTKLARTRACVSARCASSVVKSGTSAARASRLEQARPGRLRVERAREAQPQDLRQVLIEPHRRAQHVGVLRRQQAEPRRLVEHARGRGIENVRLLGRMHELQILRDEFEVDQPAGDVFQVPALLVALLGRDRGAHLHDVAGDRLGVARAAQHVADHLLDPRRESRASRRRRARASAPGAPRSRPRSPDSSRTSRAWWRPARSGRRAAAACRHDRARRSWSAPRAR